MALKSGAAQLNLEEIDCPLCHNSEKKVLYSFSPYNYNKCPGCGLIYINPRLTEEAILLYYSDDNFYSEYSAGSGYEVQELALRATFRSFLKQLKRKGLTGGRLLDVGCGYGYLLDEAKGYFSYRAGTDFSSEALEHAKKYCDDVYCGGLEAIPEGTEKFDCIVTFSVIEHVYDPGVFVADIRAKLKPNGSVIISTSNVGNFWHSMLKEKWPLFIPPEHVCLYDKSTIAKLLEKDFKDVETFDSKHYWPLAVFLAKLRLKNISEFFARGSLGKIPVPVPKIIISVSGKKP